MGVGISVLGLLHTKSRTSFISDADVCGSAAALAERRAIPTRVEAAVTKLRAALQVTPH